MQFTIESGDRLRAVCASCGKEAQWFYRGLDNDYPVIEIVCACGKKENSRLSPGSVGFHHSPFTAGHVEENMEVLKLVRYCKAQQARAAAAHTLARALGIRLHVPMGEVDEQILAAQRSLLQTIDAEYRPLESALVDGAELRSVLPSFVDKHPST